MKKMYEPLYESLGQYCLEWRVTAKEENSLGGEAVFEYGPQYSGFAGHFPGRPLLPAIVQLASVRFLAELLLALPLQPVNYNRAKFRGIVVPGEKIEIKLMLNEKNDAWLGSFTLQKLGGKAEVLTSGNCKFISVKS